MLLSLRVQGEIDFHVWFSPGFLMQCKVARQESFRCVARPNSSLVLSLLWLFLHLNFFRSFRHHFRTLCRTEMAYVKQTQQMIPLIACEISFGQCVCELVFWCQCIWFGFWGPHWFDRTTNQEQVCGVLETCLIVGRLAFMIILITASLSSNTYNKASWREDWTFEGIKSTLSKSLIFPWDCLRLWIVWGGGQTSRLFNNGSSRSIQFWVVFPRTKQSDPINHDREYHLTSIQCPKRWFQILLNCLKLKFVSNTSIWLGQMCVFQKPTMLHPK